MTAKHAMSSKNDLQMVNTDSDPDPVGGTGTTVIGTCTESALVGVPPSYA